MCSLTKFRRKQEKNPNQKKNKTKKNPKNKKNKYKRCSSCADICMQSQYIPYNRVTFQFCWSSSMEYKKTRRDTPYRLYSQLLNPKIQMFNIWKKPKAMNEWFDILNCLKSNYLKISWIRWPRIVTDFLHIPYFDTFWSIKIKTFLKGCYGEWLPC